MTTPDNQLASDGGTGVLPETVVTSTRPPPITTSINPELETPTVDAGPTAALPPITPIPTSRQYGRKISLIVATSAGIGLELSKFRVTFNTQRGDFQNPNTADIRVYNLSGATASQIAQKEFTQLAIQAGYEGNFGLIFRGVIAQARIGRESQTDSYVDFTAADGDEAYNFSAMALALGAGAKPANEVEAFLQSMATAGITQGYSPTFSKSGSVRGETFWGCTKDVLREFARDNDVTWSIQDGQLTFIPQTSYIPGEPVLLSAATGMIGIPEQTENGISVRCLLNPSIKIGQRIQIEGTINQFRFVIDIQSFVANANIHMANRLNSEGLYYVMTANHSGDTRGNKWYIRTWCACRSMRRSQQTVFHKEPLARLDRFNDSDGTEKMGLLCVAAVFKSPAAATSHRCPRKQ